MPGSRFTPTAAATLRRAIAEAGGIEVFAIGDTDAHGEVCDLEVHCRGNEGSVPALRSRPRPGQVVIHNHPSGVLQASDADMALAHRYGEDGIGVVIVDNEVNRALWVVEPHKKERVRVDPAAVEAFFRDDLPRVLGDSERRAAQVAMALEVTARLNEGGVAAIEAGTGTGKSLAYLVPAALWARANDAKVAVATYTITLQGQLVASDLPLLRKAGLDVRWALLKGRGNYVCRRQLEEASAHLDDRDDTERATLAAIRDWAQTSADGSKSDLPFGVSDDLWDEIGSDHDKTLRARCPHFARCFYYEARRAGAAAHILVTNHHLLLADLELKHTTGADGILPRFDRLVLDEAHHLEDAATSLFREQVSAKVVARTTARLLPRKKRPGALALVRDRLGAPDAPGDPLAVRRTCDVLENLVDFTRTDVRDALGVLAADLLDASTPLRLTPATREETRTATILVPALEQIQRRVAQTVGQLDALQDALSHVPERERLLDPQPLFDLDRAHRRLSEVLAVTTGLLGDDPAQVQWIEPTRDDHAAVLCTAPVEVGPILRERLFDAVATTVATSATLTVGASFDHWKHRVGLGESEVHTQVHDSPFDWERQALLGLPRDLPDPDDPTFLAATAALVQQAIAATPGGVFVLCTSYRQVDQLHRAAEQVITGRPLLTQRAAGRDRLLQRFLQHDNAVLFGTDSFWEGVSVKGDKLQLVVIPRLPFRVPTEPVQQARHERLAASGADPFRHYSLPQAVLRLRQGVGRLIRTRQDRGAVLVLDRRVMSRWYGRVFLASLPPMRRVTGPSRAVLEELRRLWDATRQKGPDAYSSM